MSSRNSANVILKKETSMISKQNISLAFRQVVFRPCLNVKHSSILKYRCSFTRKSSTTFDEILIFITYILLSPYFLTLYIFQILQLWEESCLPRFRMHCMLYWFYQHKFIMGMLKTTKILSNILLIYKHKFLTCL